MNFTHSQRPVFNTFSNKPTNPSSSNIIKEQRPIIKEANIVNNIIKDKPSNKIVREYFRDFIEELIEESNDDLF
jgi:hypothetical protein